MTSEPNLASSSDIAFLLIIFFMVTSAFIFKDGLQMVLPAKSKEPKVIEEKEEITIVTVLPDSLLLNDADTTLVDLEAHLKEQIDEDPDSIVLVRIGKSIRYQRIIEVVDVLKMAKVKKLSMKKIAEEEEGG